MYDAARQTHEDWGIVATKYSTWAKLAGYPRRHLRSLRNRWPNLSSLQRIYELGSRNHGSCSGSVTEQRREPEGCTEPRRTATVKSTTLPQADPDSHNKKTLCLAGHEVPPAQRIRRVRLTSSDEAALPNYVHHVQPQSAGEWAFVTSEFASWACKKNRPPRDRKSLRSNVRHMKRSRPLQETLLHHQSFDAQT